jgi:hypothetical protein
VLQDERLRARRDPLLRLIEIEVVRLELAVDVDGLRPRVANRVRDDNVCGRLYEDLVAGADVERAQDAVQADAPRCKARRVGDADAIGERTLVLGDRGPFDQLPSGDEVA